MGCNRHNFFVILGHFLPFYSTYNLQNQNFEKMKKNTPEIWSEANRIFYFFAILDHFLASYPNDNPENQNFEKIKKRLEILYYHFTHEYHK